MVLDREYMSISIFPNDRNDLFKFKRGNTGYLTGEGKYKTTYEYILVHVLFAVYNFGWFEGRSAFSFFVKDLLHESFFRFLSRHQKTG